jgi:hypothetical protein
MANLLKETLDIIKHNGKSVADVVWVGSADGTIADSWNHFASVADFEYDNGYGRQEVAPDLVVVAKDWWLERHEYDGSEWWEFKSVPVLRDHPEAFTRLVRGENYESSLREMQK